MRQPLPEFGALIEKDDRGGVATALGLDPGDVAFVAAREKGTLAVDLFVQTGVGTGCLQLVLEFDDLVCFASDDLDRVGLAQVGFLSDPILHVCRE